MKRLINWFKHDGEFFSVVEINYETDDVVWREPKWRITPIFAWYDLWVGIYIDRKDRIVYVLPLPCCGFKIWWH